MTKEYTIRGISFFNLLAIAFIVLKLCGVITWSWLWVLSPILLGVAIEIIILLIIFVCWLVARHYAKKARKVLDKLNNL